jgi:NADPH:quinone reductase-like Zn-dependent oxidoreductase
VGILPRMGAYREIVDADVVAAVPDGLADEAAAALPLNYLTAYALIDRCARLREGESFVIHGAAGGVGTAALELARVLGLRAFGRASRHKHDVVRSLGAVPLDRDLWLSELRRQRPEGVAAVLDAFGVASFRQSWRALSPAGRLVCYGLSPSLEGGTWDFLRGLAYLAAKSLFGRRVRVCSVPWLVRARPEWVASSLARIVAWAGTGALRPVVAGTMAWHEVERAHRALASQTMSGKLLLDFA